MCTHDLAHRNHMAVDLAYCKVGTEHAGVSSRQARNQSPGAKRRGVFGESHGKHVEAC